MPPTLDPQAKGARKVRTQALALLAAADPAAAAPRAAAQYEDATTMTDRQGALMVLAGIGGRAERTAALIDFHRRFAGNALVIDKWFAIQAGSSHPAVIDQVEALAGHADFDLANPNRVRSLYHGLRRQSGGLSRRRRARLPDDRRPHRAARPGERADRGALRDPAGPLAADRAGARGA